MNYYLFKYAGGKLNGKKNCREICGATLKLRMLIL